MNSKYGEEQSYAFIRIKSVDSDVLFILIHQDLHLKVSILLATAKESNKRLANVGKLGYLQEPCAH